MSKAKLDRYALIPVRYASTRNSWESQNHRMAVMCIGLVQAVRHLYPRHGHLTYLLPRRCTRTLPLPCASAGPDSSVAGTRVLPCPRFHYHRSGWLRLSRARLPQAEASRGHLWRLSCPKRARTSPASPACPALRQKRRTTFEPTRHSAHVLQSCTAVLQYRPARRSCRTLSKSYRGCRAKPPPRSMSEQCGSK